MTLGRMIHNNKRQVLWEDEGNQLIRPKVTEKFVFLEFIIDLRYNIK